MNVLQLLPRLDIGGVERGTVDLARYLENNGHKAVIVSSGGKLADMLAKDGVVHYTLPVGKKNPFTIISMVFRLKNIIEKENIDIIHARSRIPAISGYFAAKFTKRCFITTAHGQYRKHLASYVMGWGRAVIVASSAMTRHMTETFNVHPERIRVIPRGVDTKDFTFNPKKPNEGGFAVGMISRMTPIKGHDDFIKAISIVSRSVAGLKAYIVGDLDKNPEYTAQLRAIVKRLGLSDVIEFAGQTDDVPSFLKKLDVLVSASKEQEAFGRILIEAASVGTACVATAVGGVTDVIMDNVTGLLCAPGNPEEIAQKVILLHKDVNLRNKLIVNARAGVEKNYTVEKMLRSTLEVYEEMLGYKRILVIKLSSLGDIILIMPSLKALRNKFPHACIKVLTEDRYAEVFANVPYVDGVITCGLKGRDKGMKNFLALGKRLKKDEFDITVDFQNNKKSHMLAFLSGAKVRCGYDNMKLGFLLSRKAKDSGIPMDPILHQMKVLGLLEVYDVDKLIELFPSKDDIAWADAFLNENWVKQGERIVAMHLEASPRWTTKRWPAANFVKLAEMLAKEMSVRTVVTGLNPNDEWNKEFFAKAVKSRPLNAVGKTDIGRMVALISRTKVLVTLDSASMHIAAGTGVRFAALFGPTDPKRHVPPADGSKVFFKQEKCSPCYRPMCDKGYICMKNITVDEVFKVVREMLEPLETKGDK